jgi:hypothetical protein
MSVELFSVGTGILVGWGAEIMVGVEAQAVSMSRIQPHRIVSTETFIADLFSIGTVPFINKHSTAAGNDPISL